jgi:hypothetical protein
MQGAQYYRAEVGNYFGSTSRIKRSSAVLDIDMTERERAIQ